MSNTDTIYTESLGTTCYIDGERGIVRGLHRTPIAGFSITHVPVTHAFVCLDERPAVLLVKLGAKVGDRGQHHEVVGAREIERDEFDRLTGIDTLRADMGWVLTQAASA